ncbi:MAG: (d)CMP kinase [Bacilli bacterium]|nr:(d)CMP kinase [Bacilli bacterium]
MDKLVRIAIDGPAAAGKSTIAKIIAKKLNYTYMDTGAMYRCVTWYCMNKGINCQDQKACEAVVNDIKIDLKPDNTVLCNGTDVTRAIRTPEVNANVSYIAAMKGIRLVLSGLQKEFAKTHSVVMDGRDIGTYVIPDAEVKIFMIASVECRAQRRYKENMEKNIPCTIEDIREDVKKRDYIDSHRDFAPLKKADDAVELDTSPLTIPQVVDAMMKIINEKLGA